jgi:hypothetical protein
MIVGAPESTYGGVGSIWSPMPVEYRYAPPIVNDPGVEKHFVGGRAVALHMVAAGSPCLVVQGWDWIAGGDGRRTVSVARSTAIVGDLLEGMSTRVISDRSRDTDALATCATSTSQFAVLVRALPANRRPGPSEYALLTVAGASQADVVTVTRRAIVPTWLRDGAGGVCIAAEAGKVAIASASSAQLRVTILTPGTGPVIRDFALGASGGQLAGLTRVSVASLRFAPSGLSVALTVERTLPGLGGVSQVALVRLKADGTRDPAFGPDGDGLWVSPLDPTHRHFRCAGETTGGVAGSEGGRLVLYGVVADGGLNPQIGDPAGGLDGSFGGGGIAEADFGCQLHNCVATADANWIYAFAQRIHPPGDSQLLGARFAVAGGNRDVGFGNAGTAIVQLDEPGLQPSSLLLQPAALAMHPTPPRPPLVLVALSRPTAGIDCDRIPTIAALDATNGRRVESIGYSGVAMVSRLGPPALVEPDGAILATHRHGGHLQLRQIDATGMLGALLDVPTPEPTDEIRGLTRLSDGSLLAYGAGRAGWITRLTEDGALDERFGTEGNFAHRGPPGGGAVALVLGELADGSLIVQVSAPNGKGELCRLTARGELMTDYGKGEVGSSPGYVELFGFMHLLGAGATGAGVHCFLDRDGQVIVVAASSHDPSQTGSPVTVALRRVTVDGHYDPKFGLGLPRVLSPPSDRRVQLFTPTGGTRAYNSFRAAGIVRLDSTL